MNGLDWIKDLVESERRMEETGMIDMSSIPDESRDVEQKTYEYLRGVKERFLHFVTAFNNMKNSPIGSVKIYGISNTVADFMLFRNGYKLLFSASGPGRIAMVFQHHSPQLLSPTNQNAAPTNEEYLDAKYGPFGEMAWTYRGTSVNLDSLVRYYLSRFVRESAK